MRLFVKSLIILTLIAIFSIAYTATRVKGYYRKDGTYVRPHYRSNADGNPYNNWSTKGNVNPYTGKKGYKTPQQSGYKNYNNNYSNTSYQYNNR